MTLWFTGHFDFGNIYRNEKIWFTRHFDLTMFKEMKRKLQNILTKAKKEKPSYHCSLVRAFTDHTHKVWVILSLHIVTIHYWPTREMPLEWRFAGGLIVTRYYIPAD